MTMPQARFNQWTRWIAAVTVAFFFTTTVCRDIAFALPLEKTPAVIPQLSNPYEAIPSSLGDLRDYVPGSAKAPFVIHIQDAHSNPEVQRNIAGLLEWTFHQTQGAKPVIALEGTSGSLHPEYLEFFKGRPEVNEALVQRLLKKGELTGAELFAWKHRQTKETPVETEGLEIAPLYRENLEIYKDFLEKDSKTRAMLEALRRELMHQENGILSKEAREYLREKRRRKEGQYQTAFSTPQWDVYLTYLSKALKEKVSLDLEAPFEQIRFPNVTRLNALLRTSKKVDADKAGREKEALRTLLQKKVRTPEDKQRVESFFNSQLNGGKLREKAEAIWRLSLDYRMNPKDYEAFWHLTGRDILQGEIDLSVLDKEFEQLEVLLESALASTDKAKKLFELGRRFDFLEKALSLELDAAQGGRLEAFKADALTQVLGLTPDPAVQKSLTVSFMRAERFYELARMRDEILLSHALTASHGRNTVVLISGGFHTEGMSALMKQRGIGYAVIQPRMTTLEGNDLYRQVLSEKNADVSAYFEKPDFNKQEAVFFKTMVEDGAFELLARKADANAEIRSALQSHPVLGKRFDIPLPVSSKRKPVPRGKNTAALPQKVQAVVVTPLTTSAKNFMSLYPGKSASRKRWMPAGEGLQSWRPIQVSRAESRPAAQGDDSGYDLSQPRRATGIAVLDEAAARLIAGNPEKEIFWKDPLEQSNARPPRHARFQFENSHYSQWQTHPETKPLASGLHFLITPTAAEVEAFSDLNNLFTGETHTGGFGALSGDFFLDETQEPVFLLSIVQTGLAWQSLQRTTKDRYDPRRGTSQRAEGSRYSWYGAGIAAVEDELLKIGIRKIQLLSAAGVREVRELSGKRLGDEIINKMYARPGAGYEAKQVTLYDGSAYHRVQVWEKTLRSEDRRELPKDDKGRLSFPVKTILTAGWIIWGISAALSIAFLPPIVFLSYLPVAGEGLGIITLVLMSSKYPEKYGLQMFIMGSGIFSLFTFFHLFVPSMFPDLIQIPASNFFAITGDVAIRTTSVWLGAFLSDWFARKKASSGISAAKAVTHGLKWAFPIGLAGGYYIFYVFLPFITASISRTSLPFQAGPFTADVILRTSFDLGVANLTIHTWMMILLGSVFGEDQKAVADLKKIPSGKFFQTSTGKTFLAFFPVTTLFWFVALLFMWSFFDTVDLTFKLVQGALGVTWVALLKNAVTRFIVTHPHVTDADLVRLRQNPAFNNVLIQFRAPETGESFKPGDIVELIGTLDRIQDAEAVFIKSFPDYARVVTTEGAEPGTHRAIFVRRAESRSSEHWAIMSRVIEIYGEQKNLSLNSLLGSRILNVGLETHMRDLLKPSALHDENIVTELREVHQLETFGLDPDVPAGLPPYFIKGYVQQMLFSDASFSSVISVGLFDPNFSASTRDAETGAYLSKNNFYERSAAEIDRVLVPGGRFFVSFYWNPDLQQLRPFFEKFKSMGYTVEEVREEREKPGFSGNYVFTKPGHPAIERSQRIQESLNASKLHGVLQQFLAAPEKSSQSLQVDHWAPKSLGNYAQKWNAAMGSINGLAVGTDVHIFQKEQGAGITVSGPKNITLIELHGALHEEPVPDFDFPGERVVLVHRPEEVLNRINEPGRESYAKHLEKASAIVLLGKSGLLEYQKQYPDKIVVSIPHGFFEDEASTGPLPRSAIQTLGSVTLWGEMRHLEDALNLAEAVKKEAAGEKILFYLGGPVDVRYENLQRFADRPGIWFLNNDTLQTAYQQGTFTDVKGFREWLFTEAKGRVIVRSGTFPLNDPISQLESGLIDFNVQLFREITNQNQPKVEYSGALHTKPGSVLNVVFDSPAMRDIQRDEGLQMIQVPFSQGEIQFKAGAERLLQLIRSPEEREQILTHNQTRARELGMPEIAFAYYRLFQSLQWERLRAFLDSRPHAVWYSDYSSGDAAVEYANMAFANVFGKSHPYEITQARTYENINPPGAPVEQYKTEDRRAIQEGIFMNRGGEPAIAVVKVKFGAGVLGFFAAGTLSGDATLENLEPELLETLKTVRPDLFPEASQRHEARAVESEKGISEAKLRQILKQSTHSLRWHQAISAYQPSKPSDKVDVTLQIARGVKMTVPMLRAALTDPELSESAYRYLASWAYNLSIIYGTSFVAVGVEGQPGLVSINKIKHLLTQGDLSNIRENLSKKDEQGALGIANYANGGKPVRFKRLTALTDDEKKEEPLDLGISLKGDAEGIYLGIDVGGGSAKLEVVRGGKSVEIPESLQSFTTKLFDEHGQAVQESPEAYAMRAAQHVRAVQAHLGVEFDGVGIDTPGAKDLTENKMVTLGQILLNKNWTQAEVEEAGKLLPQLMADELKIPRDHVVIRNDMDGVLPGVAYALKLTGNFRFDYMGNGHGNQNAINGVPMNAPTEAGHMFYEFGRPGKKIFDTEANTSIPSMLRWGQQLARRQGVVWPELDEAVNRGLLKPLVDPLFMKNPDPRRAAIADRVLKRFAEKYAANLALHYTMALSTGKGSPDQIVFGGGITRGRTGPRLRKLTREALKAYGLDRKIKIRLVTDSQIEKGGVNPKNVGAFGMAMFIQSILAARKASSAADPAREEWEALEKEWVVGEAAKQVLPALGIDPGEMRSVFEYVLRYGGPVQKLIEKLRMLKPDSYPLLPITLHIANNADSYRPKWLSSPKHVLYLKLDPRALVKVDADGNIISSHSPEELQERSQNFLSSLLGDVLTRTSLDPQVRSIAESEFGYAFLPRMEDQPLDLVDFSSVAAAFVNAQEYRDLIQAGTPETAFAVFSSFKKFNGGNWPVKQLLPEWHGSDAGYFKDDIHAYLGIMNHLVYIAPFKETPYFDGMIKELEAIFPPEKVQKALAYAVSVPEIQRVIFSDKPVMLQEILQGYLVPSYRLLGREVLRKKIADQIGAEDADKIEWNGLSAFFEKVSADLIQGKNPEFDFSAVTITPYRGAAAETPISLAEWASGKHGKGYDRIKIQGLEARAEQRGLERDKRDREAELFRSALNYPATRDSREAAFRYVDEHGVGNQPFSDSERSIAVYAEGFYGNPEVLARRLNLPVLEVYGRMIKTWMEESGENEFRDGRVWEIVKRHLGQLADSLENEGDVRYQYLDLVGADEVSDDTAYALAVLSFVRPRDRIQLSITGEPKNVRDKIARLKNTYKNILDKMGRPERANLSLLDASGLSDSEIQKQMSVFAAGKQGTFQTAILSVRPDFLAKMPASRNSSRMNRYQVNRSEALFAVPALFSGDSLRKDVYAVLQMREELERLGLGGSFSAHFAQMITEIKALAVSA